MIVTAEHVTAGMRLSTEDWKPLEIVDGDGSQFIAARQRHSIEPHPHRNAVAGQPAICRRRIAHPGRYDQFPVRCGSDRLPEA